MSLLLQRLSSVAAPARMRAATPAPGDSFWYTATPWLSALSASGVAVTPELAMTLSAMYAGVTMISLDLATLPAQTFRLRDDGGKDRVKAIFGRGLDSSNGIGSMAYMLRWQPNAYQTATEFWLAMAAQYLLREVAYAEILSNPQTGIDEQLLTRHPDRITPERLPSGRVRYKLREPGMSSRYVLQDEMFVVRGLSLDGGVSMLSRVAYGAQSIGSAIATQKAAGKFFKSGMTAAMLATYVGGSMTDEAEAALHASISRYAAGVENSFGLMLVPDDVKISNLAVEPEKAQMMEAQQWGVREVARLLRLPGSKLGIKDSVSYGSAVQAALDYVITCLRPIAISFEQAIQRDLILAKDTYVVEFLLAALMRGDFEQQSNYLDKFLRNRTMRPSEARLILNMNPDAELDELWKSDFRPGSSSTQADRARSAAATAGAWSPRANLKALLSVHDNAVRCLRRERAAVEKLAKRHASDVPGWQAALREFYGEHAAFVGQTMRLAPSMAAAYAAQHGSEVEAKGIILFSEAWERDEAEALCELALCDEREAA